MAKFYFATNDTMTKAARLNVMHVIIDRVSKRKDAEALFALKGARVKLVVHDGFGVWCAMRRLNQGRFCWPSGALANEGAVSVDNSHLENLMRPWAMGRKASSSPEVNSPASERPW